MRRLFSGLHAEFNQSLADGIIDHEEVAVECNFGWRSGLRLSQLTMICQGVEDNAVLLRVGYCEPPFADG